MAGPDRLRRQAAGAVRLNAAALKEIGAALEQATTLASDATTSEGPIDSIDSTAWRLSLPVKTLLVGQRLDRLTELPLRLSIVIAADPHDVRIDSPPGAPAVVRYEEPLPDQIEFGEIGEFRAAADNGDVRRVLGWFVAAEVDVTVEVVNRPEVSGVRWIRREASLRDMLGKSWLAILQRIFSSGRPATLIVADAAADLLEAGSLCVCGPEATTSEPDAWPSGDAERWWREHRGRQPPLPAPTELIPAEYSGEHLTQVKDVLLGTARALVWLWLAESIDESDDIPKVEFAGKRVAVVELTVEPAESATDEVALWEWAMEGTDPGRHQAVQEAIALAVFSRRDLPRAARPALKTASTLLRTMRQDELAEALATRREVRNAAIAVGQAAAEAGRVAGAKSLERVVVQAVAGAGILIAQGRDALSAEAAFLLLLLVGALLLASGAIALLADYPAAFGMLSSFKDDLRLYEDTLSDEDIEGIEEMRSLRQANGRIKASLAITVTILVFALIALIVAICLTDSPSTSMPSVYA